jgi:hypothetical protein
VGHLCLNPCCCSFCHCLLHPQELAESEDLPLLCRTGCHGGSLHALQECQEARGDALGQLDMAGCSGKVAGSGKSPFHRGCLP